MRTPPLLRLLVITALTLVAPLSVWAASVSKLESMGDNTFAITRTATSGFDRDVRKFRQEAEQDALQYCTSHGKMLKVVAVTSDRPHFGGGFASARIIFRALDAGDPALTAVEAPAPAPAATTTGTGQSVAAPTGVLPTYAGDLYSEILKLDDLRKRGLLSDKEFEQQKKKLLKKFK
jgi:hypothetical protein